jgi:ABC-type Fe3+ transport system permease subunit
MDKGYNYFRCMNHEKALIIQHINYSAVYILQAWAISVSCYTKWSKGNDRSFEIVVIFGQMILCIYLKFSRTLLGKTKVDICITTSSEKQATGPGL